MEPRYPNVSVKLVGEDGNALLILGRCMKVMQRAKLPPEEIDAFLNEAKSGDYDNLLQTCMKWVNVL